MPAQKLDPRSGLKEVLLFEDGYNNWGWVCWKCSTPGWMVWQDDLGTRNAAYKQAKRHEKRRGH